MRETYLPYALPQIEEEEINGVLDTLKSGWLTKGPKTVEFEKEFANYVGSKYAIALNSCTAGLHLSLLALGIGKGDEVITTPYTFIATVNTIVHAGATPVLVDVNEDSLNINANLIEEKINEKTKAIMPVHFAGYPCDMEKIKQIADKHNLHIIEDAAHAVYTQYKGQMVGSIGDLTSFSFYATKNLCTGEGGMVTTDNEQLADKLRVLSLHGMSKNAWNRYAAKGSWYYEVEEPGYKYNMTDIQAALGIAQLKKLEEMQQKRKLLAEIYNTELKGIEGIKLPYDNPKEAVHAWHLYVIRVDKDLLGISREDLIVELSEHNIGTSVHFIPLHLHPYYRACGFEKGQFPVAEKAYEGAVSLPLYPTMSEKDIYDVIEALKSIVARRRS